MSHIHSWYNGNLPFAVVHEDLRLATDTEVFSSGLCGVGHGDERDVGVCEGLRGFPVSNMSIDSVIRLGRTYSHVLT
jgi:hypothetical protein